MSADREPPRWNEAGSDVPGELRELLRVGRGQLGTAQDVAQLSRSLAQTLGPAAGLGVQSGAAPAAKLAGTAWRWVAGLAAGAGGAVAIWVLTAGPPGAPVSSAPSSSAAAAPQPDRTEPPTTASASQATAPELPPAPASEPVPAPPKAAPSATKAPSETELLERAQAVLVAEPRRALELTTEHQRRFADGALAEEREAIAIEALRRLGRTQAAQQRAAAFAARYPDSVHRQRVRGPLP